MNEVILVGHKDVGKKFNRWTILKVFKRERDKNRKCFCKCDCGVEKIIALSSVKHEYSKSCGCYSLDTLMKRNITHGFGSKETRTTEYDTLAGMKRRCTNSKEKFYKDYGGRGIIVCDRWSCKQGFQNFLDDMGEKPSPKELYSIDRIDVNGNYEPGNCRWATREQQLQNKRPILIRSYNVECLGCKKIFRTYPSYPRKYCGHSCAAVNIARNNEGRFKDADPTTPSF